MVTKMYRNKSRGFCYTTNVFKYHLGLITEFFSLNKQEEKM